MKFRWALGENAIGDHLPFDLRGFTWRKEPKCWIVSIAALIHHIHDQDKNVVPAAYFTDDLLENLITFADIPQWAAQAEAAKKNH